jgi:cytidyltransferase-like protein
VTLRPSSSKDGSGLTGASISSITVSSDLSQSGHAINRMGLTAHPHSGHAGAVVQARQLGDELYVGVHSDEAILENKGPTVMNQTERYLPPFPTPLPSTSH